MKLESKTITPVIICGGSGTRLWPLSRETSPKQFMPIAGISMFEKVLERIKDGEIFGRAIVVTHADFRFTVAEQIQKSGVQADIILEPIGRDSGPAICTATVFASRRDPKAIILALPADHIVRDIDKFRNACLSAKAAAVSGNIVTFGVRPTAPTTSYGYIEPGAKLKESESLKVKAFVEKPDIKKAVEYIAAGYLWNSGNFLFRADVMLGEIEKFEPQMLRAATASIDGMVKDLDFYRLPEKTFLEAPKKSIDFAVMERTSVAAVLAVDFGWSDVGSWNTLWKELPQDSEGNAVEGPVTLRDTRNSLVLSDATILTAVVGFDDIVVVSTTDAVLVIPKSHAEKVKDLVVALKNEKRPEVAEHLRIHRPWGYYQRTDVGPRYQVKKILVKPGAKLSLQKHLHRAEHWVVVKGTADVTLNERTLTLHENESIYLPIGAIHRLGNSGKIPLEIIEVQVGSYLGEDDIIRFEDIYSRS
jgi:mannose-1-phosphate guanylyltransferase/mannose-6-phosphate isomerase